MNRMKLGLLAGLADLEKEGQQCSQSSSGLENTPSGTEPDSATIHGAMHFRAVGAESACFIPLHYQSGHSYPLVIWLHSTASNHHQLNDVMPLVSEQNYVGVSILGTESFGGERFGWLQSSDSIETAVNHVQHAINAVSSRLNINHRRIFIAGRGAGGTMAFRIAFEQPSLFAGIASINGSLPSNLNPLCNLRNCRQLPVYWAHGRQSVDFPESNLCHQLKLLHIGGFDVTLRQYPCADQLPGQVYGDFNHWMMEVISKSGANVVG